MKPLRRKELKSKMRMETYVRPQPLYPYEAWSLSEETYDEANNQRSESLFAIGNGYIGMRGNFEEGFYGMLGTSVTGNYLNGFYDSEPIVYPEGAYGYPERNHAMLNVTNAQRMDLRIEGQLFHLNSGVVHDYRRELDMKKGMLTREIEWEAPGGQRARIRIRRFAALQHKHLAAIHYEVTALNFSGAISLISALDGKIASQNNNGDPRLGAVKAEPSLLLEDAGRDGELTWMRQRTRHSGFVLLTAMSHDLQTSQPSQTSAWSENEYAASEFTVSLRQGESAALTKYVTYHTSKDYAEGELLVRAEEVQRMARQSGFEVLAQEQQSFLEQFWKTADVEIAGDPALQQGIRFNAFQLLQSVGRDGVTNIGAKGLTGEGYEGHYFWDTEMYMLPFFTYTRPDIARALLHFRYATLDKARERARVMSQKGALFPWRTIDGEENSSYYPAGTAQAHINADIAYGIKQYVSATGDSDFLLNEGAEILFETSRFWVDLGHFNPARDGKFCIDGVTGPDEYTAIVNNNAYTNLMVQDQLRYAVQVAGWLAESHPAEDQRLRAAIGLTDEEIALWGRAAENMFVPYDAELGIYAQDDTFLTKAKWDFQNTPADKYPLLLHFHPLVIYRHQVLKQADLVLALFLLGERFTMEEKIRNYRYYEPLTTHDSSLSPCIHSIVSAEIGELDEAYAYFDRTVRMDLDDINRNAKDGLHTAAMAGSWMSIVYGFAGMRLVDGMLEFAPALPGQWDSYRFRIMNQGRLLEVLVDAEGTGYGLLEGEPLQIRHKGEELTLEAGKTVRR